MEFLDNSQIAEQISVYEIKVKAKKEKIRDELQIRRDLKAKINEAKKGESTQILYLERLDACEKIVTKELESAEKMEDSESIKQLAMIKQYENMLRDQQEIWAKYEEQYEKFPLAKEKQKSELRLMKVNIEDKSMDYKIEITKRILRMKNKIDKRREQLKIIEFAKLYVEHKKREKCCSELANKVNNLKIKERQLSQEVQNLKRQVAETEKLESSIKKTSMKTQSLPQVDLSHFIIHRNKNDINLDTISVNTYILEQEYMNTDDEMKEPTDNTPIMQTLEDKSPELVEDTMDVDHIEAVPVQATHSKQRQKMKNFEAINERGRQNSENPHMSLYNKVEQFNNVEQQTQTKQSIQSLKMLSIERANEYNRRMNFNSHMSAGFHRNAFNNEESMQSDPSNQLSNSHSIERFQESNRNNYNNPYANTLNNEQQQNQTEERVNEHERSVNFNFNINKKSSQENQPELLPSDSRISLTKRVNQHQPIKDDAQGTYFINNENGETPAKIVKRSAQEQYQSSPKGNPDPENLGTVDLTRLPRSNKPQIKACERVNYNMQMQFQMVQRETLSNTHVVPANSSTQTPANVNASTMQQTPQQTNFNVNMFQHNKLNPAAMQENANITPMGVVSPVINTSSMMSPSLNLVDGNMYGGDTISAILGSEVTEPGGSFELARRLYGDSDMNSDDGDFDYEKMLDKFCSPIPTNQKVHQQPQQQQSINVHDQAQATTNTETLSKPSTQEKNEKNFNFAQLGKKQSQNQTQRFF